MGRSGGEEPGETAESMSGRQPSKSFVAIKVSSKLLGRHDVFRLNHVFWGGGVHFYLK